MNALRQFVLGGLALTLGVGPVSACGPFLFDNADLDRFSLLDPAILNSSDWTPFLAFASPAYGLDASGLDVQQVIHPDRVSLTAGQVSNLVYDYDPGADPVSVAANETWWKEYFRDVRRRNVTPAEVQSLLYEGARPSWLATADRGYLDLLTTPENNGQAYQKAEAAASDARLPLPLRHRYAFWAVRSLALVGGTGAWELFHELCPGPAADLPLARAQGWAASSLAESDPRAALGLWLDLLVRWPELRAQTFSSLATVSRDSWAGLRTPEALVARFFLDGRDFSPETLGALAVAEKASGRDGRWTEAVLYAMAEQVEAESGVFALFGLVDPHEVPPQGLFTGLVDRAEALADGGVQKPNRTWWLTAAYLALFDGAPGRAAGFLTRARAYPARNPAQESQTRLLAALVQMDAERDRDWSPELQTQVVQALDWGLSLQGTGHNRGLFHSVVLLAAQKSLARGHNAQAALAFGLVQAGSWSNPYRLRSDDGFWTTGWSSNNPVNLFFDALVTDEDLVQWKALLKARDSGPLTARLAAHPFLTDQDLTWWQAHRALRRGDGPLARELLASLGSGWGSSTFPRRSFSYSLDLDPLKPGSGRGMVTVEPAVLADQMGRIEADARERPTALSLLAQGEFWFSLQLSGLPLLFSQPPVVIGFVNDNYEYYGYDGRDVSRTTTQVGEFPLGRPGQTDQWTRRLAAFYRDEFTALDRARMAFEAVVARREDPEAEYRALLFLQALDNNRAGALADRRYDSLPLAEEFRSTCEAFR